MNYTPVVSQLPSASACQAYTDVQRSLRIFNAHARANFICCEIQRRKTVVLIREGEGIEKEFERHKRVRERDGAGNADRSPNLVEVEFKKRHWQEENVVDSSFTDMALR